MRIFVQPVKSAVVEHESRTVANIESGVVVYIGIRRGEFGLREHASNDFRSLVNTLLDGLEKCLDENGSILCLSQFTLYGAFKGSKPSFHKAEEHNQANSIFQEIVETTRNRFPSRKIAQGIFGVQLKIHLVLNSKMPILLEEGG